MRPLSSTEILICLIPLAIGATGMAVWRTRKGQSKPPSPAPAPLPPANAGAGAPPLALADREIQPLPPVTDSYDYLSKEELKRLLYRLRALWLITGDKRYFDQAFIVANIWKSRR
jgi:hypothetical protein